MPKFGGYRIRRRGVPDFKSGNSVAAGQASGAAMSGERGEARENLPTLPVRRFRDRHGVFPVRGYLRIPAAAFGLIWSRKSAAGRQKVAFQMQALPWTRIVKAVLTAAGIPVAANPTTLTDFKGRRGKSEYVFGFVSGDLTPGDG